MKFTEAVNILIDEFGDELSNERRKMKRYVKNNPDDKQIAEAFESYIKVVGMPKKGEKKINWKVAGGKRDARPSPYRQWWLIDIKTGTKEKYRTAQEIADKLGCHVANVTNARNKKQICKKRYKVIAVK